jgi:hypothetical protein
MNFLSNITRFEGDPKVLQSGPSSVNAADRLARVLGWFSIGLGVAELVAPGRITRALGMEGKESLIRAYGAREVAAGIMSLSPDKHLGLWSRVVGDGLDIATLLSAARPDNPKRDNVGLALAMVVGVTLLDIVGAQTTSTRGRSRNGPPRSYRNRSGFPQGVEAARGAARDFRRLPGVRGAPVQTEQHRISAQNELVRSRPS